MFLLAFIDLTLREIVSDIPHDAGAVVAYILLILFVGFTVLGSRRGKSSSNA
ncbi:hypothetical protein BH23GEM8_BH23GEM8_13190 [soil metagenome]